MAPEEKFDAALASAQEERRALIAYLENFSDSQAHWEPPAYGFVPRIHSLFAQAYPVAAIVSEKD